MGYQEGLNELQNLRREIQDADLIDASATESDTRAKVITRILAKVLQWPEKQIERETKSASGYLDYLLKCPHPVLVVEAKRFGAYFHLPAERERRTYALESLRAERQHVGKAVRQVRSYADDNGVEFGCVTNGAQWIVFRAITLDLPWTKGEGFVFRGLQDLEDNFTIFWNLLSYEAVRYGSLRSNFTKTAADTPQFERPLDTLLYANNPLQRNPLSSQLQPIMQGLFRDLTSDEQEIILRRCYVIDRKVQGVSKEFEELLNDTVPAFAKSAGFQDLVETTERSGAIDDDFRRAVEQGRFGTTVLLLGGVGCGKTTFIHRFLRITARDFIQKHCLYFYVPFTVAALERKSVSREILAQLRLRYSHLDINSGLALRSMYAEDLASLKSGLWTELPEPEQRSREITFLEERLRDERHCDRVLRYLRTAGHAITVVLDNVDHRDPPEQVRIFLLGHELCKDLDAIVIVALREESYFRAEQAGAFNAYHNIRYHIASPDVRTLLRKRVEYVLSLAQRGSGALRMTLRSGVSFRAKEVAAFMSILKETALKENPAISQFIDAVAQGNMRMALDMFNQFMVSGSTNVENMLDKYRKQGRYNVAEHEFMKAVMLGDYQFYRDSRSPIANVFEVSGSPVASNLTGVRLLTHLDGRSGQSHPEGEGFVALEEVLGAFRDVFGQTDDADFHLARFVKRRMVEPDNRQVSDLEGVRFVRITKSGRYYFRQLVRRFQYLDLVSMDTPISDGQVVHELRSRANAHDLYERISRVEWFLKYLRTDERRSLATSARGLAVRLGWDDLVREIESGYRDDLNRVCMKAGLDRRKVVALVQRIKSVHRDDGPGPKGNRSLAG